MKKSLGVLRRKLEIKKIVSGETTEERDRLGEILNRVIVNTSTYYNNAGFNFFMIFSH